MDHGIVGCKVMGVGGGRLANISGGVEGKHSERERGTRHLKGSLGRKEGDARWDPFRRKKSPWGVKEGVPIRVLPYKKSGAAKS